MIEFVIIIAIAAAVWFYINFSKKKNEAEIDSSVETVATQKVTSEVDPGLEVDPEPETEVKEVPEPEIEVALETTVQEPVAIKATEINEVADDIPEDSTLRRHYLQNLGVADSSSTAVAEAVEEPVSEVVAVETNSVSGIPEDAVLKRHFIQQLTAGTEAAMPARPTDSTLMRHYDAQLLSSVLSQLEALK